MKKRLKLPNGYGSVSYRGDRRRRQPYAVKVSIKGKQVPIGYTETYEDGLAMLADYHKDPTKFVTSNITFAEVYRLMATERYKQLAEVTAKNYDSAFKHCCSIHNKRFAALRPADLQRVITESHEAGRGNASQRKIRQVMHHCYTYAIKYEIINAAVDYSQYVDIDKHTVRVPKNPFNTRQLNRVKALIGSDEKLSDWATTVVMLCYAGTRPSEFLSVLKADVKLKQRYFIIRESKTEAGRNRVVPISRKTLPYFEYWMAMPGKTLITNVDGNAVPYRTYRLQFKAVMKASRCKHTPHECRHTLATWLDNAGANELSIKRILGHAAKGVTQKVYTHKSIAQLRKAIDLI